MSFFKTKTVSHFVRDINLKFRVFSKKDTESLQYFGKMDEEQSKNPEMVKLASDEIINALVSHLVDEGKDLPTAEDFNELSHNELVEIITKVSGSQDSMKKLNQKNG